MTLRKIENTGYCRRAQCTSFSTELALVRETTVRMNTEMTGLYNGSRLSCEAERILSFTQNLEEYVSWNTLYWDNFFLPFLR